MKYIIIIIGLYLFLVACKNDQTSSVQQSEKVEKRQDTTSKQDIEKEDTHDTVRYNYTGRIGKLPINCTLFFFKNQKKEEFKEEFYGSYYYTTYKPNEIYKLKGGFAIAEGCLLPNDDAKKQKEFENFSPIRLWLQEYTSQKMTATISVCYKKDMSYMKGYMYNTEDGKTFDVILERK